MASLRKRRTRDGFLYYIDFRFNGRRYVKSTKTSGLKVARNILKDIEGQIARGTFNLEQYEKKDVALGTFFKEYFEYAQTFKNARTIVNERNYCRKFLATVGDRNLRSIDIHLLDKWKTAPIKKVSATTFNIERRTLQGIFSIAVKWGYLDQNPFKQVEKIKTGERRLYLKDDELSRIMELIDKDILKARDKKQRNYNKKFKLLIEFLLNTGFRREEALKLTRKDIDLSKNIVILEKTKNKQLRMVPINNRAREILSQLDEELFSDLEKSSVTHKFMRYLTKAGLQGFKLHSLRHTFATRLISLGYDLYTVSLLLGHSDIRTSMRYAKAGVEVLRGAVERLENGYKMVTQTTEVAAAS
jgi:integrase